MVWAYITSKGVGKIFKVTGNMNSSKYCQVLEDVFLNGMCEQNLNLNNYVFVQDNAPCHKSSLTKKWLAEQNIKCIDWPPNSPDINLIENVWHILKIAVRRRDSEITNKDDLWKIIQKEFYKIKPDYIRKLYISLPRRIKSLKNSNFYTTKY